MTGSNKKNGSIIVKFIQTESKKDIIKSKNRWHYKMAACPALKINTPKRSNTSSSSQWKPEFVTTSHYEDTRMWASRNVTTTVKNLLMFMTRAVWLNVISIPMFVINGHKDMLWLTRYSDTRLSAQISTSPPATEEKHHGWNNRNSNTLMFWKLVPRHVF